MTASFTKLGKDYAFILGESQFQELQIDLESQFEVRAENGKVVLTPLGTISDSAEAREEKFQECMADIHARFGNAMKRLAE